MENIKTINVTFANQDVIPMYELKLHKHWTWEEMIIQTVDFYRKNNLIGSSEEESPTEVVE